MAETVTVHFATNREEIRKRGAVVGFGKRPHQNSALWLRYGAAEMAARADGDGYDLAELRVARETIPDGSSASAKPVLGSQEVFDGLRARLAANGADLVALIHGFASTFESALSNAAELKTRLSAPALPVETAAFCWPSDGALFPFWAAYYADRSDVRASAEAAVAALKGTARETAPLIGDVSMRDDARSAAKAAERALLRIRSYLLGLPREEMCERNMHLIAHSMGNYMLRNALQAMISDLGERRLPRLFKNIFLMAADEDDDAFEHADKLARLPELAEAVHVYFARNDRALTISDITKGNRDRLGTAGPRTLAVVPHKVVLVDCTEVSDTGLSDARHQYYRKRPEVLADMRAVLSGLPPEQVPNRVWVPERSCWRIRPAR